MWQISEMKSRAHFLMGTAYWRSVLAALVLFLLTGGLGAVMCVLVVLIAQTLFGGAVMFNDDFGMDGMGGSGGFDGGSGYGGSYGGDYGAGAGSDGQPFGLALSYDAQMPGFAFGIPTGLFWFVFGVVLLLVLIAVCIVLFVLTPIHIGGRRFFIVNHAMPGRAKSSEIFHVFSHSYLNAICAMLLRAIYLIIWALILPAIAITIVNVLNWYDPSLNLYLPLWAQVLLMFPAFIKSYTYMLVPYIIAEEPGMSGSEAIALSKDMMRGNKMHAFGLNLSFLGWDILNCLTLGILGVLYVFPYKETTRTEMYTVIRDEYLKNTRQNNPE